ncbi:MAG: prolyl oligopeptidase family serine peptidase [Bryobacterales bacterium]|nr:prolyl oligopeptidase family serine peptidase [Bryobacterales bacterium]
MVSRRVACWLGLVAAVACAAPWTVDDLLLAERGGQLELSRDGQWMAWIESRMDKDKGESVANVKLRRITADGEYTLAVTRGKDNHAQPAFSPNSQRLAFLSSRKDPEAEKKPDDPTAGAGMQVWLADLRGGEPEALTSFEKGVRLFRWIDNDTLLLAAQENPSLHAQRVKERKDTSMQVEDERHEPPVRLWKFDVKSKRATRFLANADRISGLVVSDDGAWAVTVHDRSLRYIYDQKIRPATWLHDLKTGASTQLFTDGKLMPEQIAFRLDSKGFYFSAPHSSHPVYTSANVSRLYFYDLAARQLAEVPLDWERGLGPGFAVTSDGFLALLANGARHKAARYTRGATPGAWQRAWIEGEHAANLHGVEIAGATVVYEHSTASLPAQWYRARLNGERLEAPKKQTEFQAGWSKRTFAKTEVLTWKGAKGETVEGILYYPQNYEAGKKYPLIAAIHGGPHGADFDYFSDRWGYPSNLFTQRGSLVLKVNYHGSSNYGLAWGESISGGNYNELEWIDVETGVDALIAKGIADPARLGLMGWSNGSIITIELTTRTPRYIVASAGAGDVNWISDWGNCVFGHSFDNYYIGKVPMEDPQLYIRKSPLFRMDKVKTPTIIFFGTEDKQVPTEQGWQHFRALQHYGKADTKFILFPGEGHGPRKYVHQKRKLDEELAWFDKYLFKTLADENEALKPESPLAAALKRRTLATKMETAPRGDLAIGRFEVTRAQYQAFDAQYAVPPGTADWPANGVAFEKAKAYCEWLSKRDGVRYRLGTEEEMKAHLKASAKENTLDAWAGYAVNPDDAGRLASLVEGLGPAVLLKPVGSYAGQGEDPLFDLGGNVAEWVVDAKGAGKVLGGSADRPADASATVTARPEFTGFRVVREGGQ